MTTLAGETWFADPGLVTVMALLNGEGAETRLVGGAVRNALMGLPVSDFDLATTLTPDQVMARAAAASIRTIPTGLDHGTVTLLVEGRGFEVTTLRRDVATDGRHADVAFTTDWTADAERRDFTINALYADRTGAVHDPVGGLADIESRTIRFIGSAAERIEEDHLRILRFFRFFAHYGRGRPDAEGLKACAAAKARLASLSAERVWAEMKKLLSARDCGRALLWMRTAGVLGAVLPETEKWGIDAIPGLVAAEQAFGWKPDPLLRLAAIIPPDAGRVTAMAERLRLSNAERCSLKEFCNAPVIAPELDVDGLAGLLYRHDPAAIARRLKLMLASARAKDGDSLAGLAAIARLSGFLDRALAWQQPVCPVNGRDLIAAGLTPGPALGAILDTLESCWVDSGFRASRDTLIAMAVQLAAEGKPSH